MTDGGGFSSYRPSDADSASHTRFRELKDQNIARKRRLRRYGQGMRVLVGSILAVALVATSAEPTQAQDDRLIVVTSASGLDRALRDADPGTIVELPGDSVIDLDRLTLPLRINAGVTLRSDRGGRRRGALLRVDEEENRDGSRRSAALRPVADDVRIEGLRFRGPYSGTDEREVTVSGIYVTGEHTVDIVNNEFWAWSAAAVRVSGRESSERRADCPTGFRVPKVRIERNYMHHNQRENLGYGVGLWDGGYAMIIGNTFDWNRHAVAADGAAQTGYIATANLALSGTSVYGKWPSRYRGQHFDMHGTGDSGRGGLAGDQVLIVGNTVYGAQEQGGVFGAFHRHRAAYWLRGRPCRTSVFANNVVEHSRGDAVRADHGGDGHVEMFGNDFGTNRSRTLGVGDFDGDGRDDLFQATGAAWYYSSGGVTEWRLLRSGAWHALDRLRFGDFDGDGRTDVFTRESGRWRVAYGGTESWKTINTSSISLDRLRFGDFDGDGRTDVFRANGEQWYFSSGGTSRWQPLAKSVFKSEDLRFGDFDGDGRTDVFSLSGGNWSVSYAGSSSWQRLNAKLSGDLDSLVFADLDGDGRTDIAQSRRLPFSMVQWRVSWGGSTDWTELRRTESRGADLGLGDHWIGSFDGRRGADALRYELVPGVFGLWLEGSEIVRSSGARSDYLTHSWHPMR